MLVKGATVIFQCRFPGTGAIIWLPQYQWSDSETWWRHQMETVSALLALCAGISPVTAEFPPQRPVTRSFDVFFDLRLNKRLSKQSWGWWSETPSRSSWRHCNGYGPVSYHSKTQQTPNSVHVPYYFSLWIDAIYTLDSQGCSTGTGGDHVPAPLPLKDMVTMDEYKNSKSINSVTVT